MNKTIENIICVIELCILTILCASIASAVTFTVYQENANVTTCPSGDAFCDGKWNQISGRSGYDDYMTYFLQPYTTSVKWKTYDQMGLRNITVVNQCIVNNVVKFHVRGHDGDTSIDYECFNGSEYINLKTFYGENQDFEEAIYSTVSLPEKYCPTPSFKKTTTINGKVYDVWYIKR